MEESVLIENMIKWAESQVESKEYAGGGLSFVGDALEQCSKSGRFSGENPKESADLYSDDMRDGVPERGAFVFYDCYEPNVEGLFNVGHCGIYIGEGDIIHAWDTVRIDEYMSVEALKTPHGFNPRYIGWVPLSKVLEQKQ
ncbi:MAG: hypothetical protein IKH20_04510 [Clostridiales bacterium]|nr:hypothetical protein [Clostridiales bacterium]